MRKTSASSFAALAVACSFLGTSRADAQCSDEACVSVASSITTVSTSDSAVLDALFNSMLGTGSAVDLTVAQHQTLASATVELDDVLASLNVLGVGTTADTALSTAAPITTQLQAISDSVRATGNTAAANALDVLRAQASAAGPTQIALGDLFQLDARTLGQSSRQLNVLDLVNAEAGKLNVAKNVSSGSTTVAGSTLGLAASISSVQLSAVVLEPAKFVCGPTGTQFYGASMRVRAHVALTGVSQPVTIPGLLSAQLNLTGFDVAAAVARASGTIDAVDDVLSTIRVSATPGIAELYLGTISDANFFDRATPIDPTSELQPGNIATVTLNVAFLSASTSVSAKSYASGSAPSASTLNFTAPYPRVLTASAGANFATNLVDTLLTNMQVTIGTLSGSLGIAGAALTTLLNDTLTVVTAALKSTASNGVLRVPLNAVVTGPLDTTLGAMGVKLGQVDVRAEAPFPVLAGQVCNDTAFCTVNDLCNGSGVCAGTARDCADALGCTTDACNETSDICTHVTSAASCTIAGACVASGTADPSNPCMVCNPTASQTAYVPAALGTSCNDGLFCTETDACNVLGACLGSVRTCSDGLGCTADVCNELNDSCVNTPLTGCVVNGACVGALADDPTNSCMTCNPALSAVAYTPKLIGSTCNDGLFCTTADLCNGSGTCTGSALNCADLLGCTSDACSEATDQCVHAVSTGCAINGLCIPAGVDDPLNPCMTCNPGVSTSAYTAKSAGTACDDGQYCTTGDVCSAGSCGGAARNCTDGLSCTSDVCNELIDLCVSTPTSGCTIGGACVSAGATDPSNPCMACNPGVSALAYTPKSSGTSCDDGLFCTTTDACNGLGLCTGAARTCTDGLNCTTDLCNETSNQCENTPVLGCTINGSCVAPGSDDPTNSCNTCNPAISTTSYTAKVSGSLCDDGLFCTTADVCNGSGTCGGVARSCTDGLLCTNDSCNEATDQCVFAVAVGCNIGGSCIASGATDPTNACLACNPSISTSVFSARAAGTGCNDGLYCTMGDVCNGLGACTGAARSCDDGLACTSDVCNELTDQCVSSQATGCLIGGSCVGTGVPDPTNGCLACNPGSSITGYTPKASGASCDDGLFCTSADRCNGAGLCAGDVRSCDDGVACTSDVCDEIGNSCVSSQANGCFIQGACVPAGADDPTSSCRACNPSSSVSAYTAKVAGTLCTDGLFCTTDDSCNGLGACVGAVRNCGDTLTCTVDSCNEATDACINAVSSGCTIDGACVAEGSDDPTNPCRTCMPSVSTTRFSLKAVGAACNDGLYCTVTDQCNVAGTCVGEIRSCGNQGGSCAQACDETADSCVSVSSACSVGGTCIAAGTHDPTNPCLVCDPQRSAVAFSLVAAGTACSDGIFCTVGDVCNADGLCGGNLRSCDDGLDCTFDDCDEDSNRCVVDSALNDSCVIGSACVAAGTASPTNPCLRCAPSVSATSYSPAPAGLSCDDGRFCSTGDTCNAEGACVGTARDCGGGSACASSCDENSDRCRSDVAGCSIDGLCVADGSADPSNPCRACNSAVNRFAYSTRAVGTSCDDGLYCTTGEACDVRGQCVGTARSCNAGNTCDQTCDETRDSCVSGLSSCSVNGACFAAGTQNPANPCEVCDPARAASGFSPRAAGTACTDGAFCTEGDACNANGQCVGQTRSCSDGLSCTTDSCDESAGRCRSELTGGCAIDGACRSAGAPDPANPCRICQPSVSTQAWTNAAATQLCNDGLFCTDADHCDGNGACTGGSTSSCGASGSECASFCDEASDVCRSDVAGCAIDGACVANGAENPNDSCQTCNTSIATTSWSLKTPGSTCSDGLYCTDGDSCSGAGQCVGQPRTCSDGLSCTSGTCSESLRGCTQDVQDGCAIADSCVVAGAVDPSSPCRVCEPSLSRTTWSNVAVGTACSDGQFCTGNDQCNDSGACVGGAPPCPGDSLGCTFENCDEATDRCVYEVTTGCAIDGLCVTQGTLRDPDDVCYICSPTEAKNAYSYQPDAIGCDSDHDGLRDGSELDSGETERDSDGDGRPDQLDSDDDNDGIPTRRETSDDDGNGLPDSARDLDEDGRPDYLDPDDDDDQRPTSVEREDALDLSNDVDEDGIPNWYDFESDGDGIDDVIENEGDGDDNDDGVPDYLQPNVAPRDDDRDGLTNTFECEGDLDNCIDSDGDGKVDYLDPDDDDDGVLTKYEIRNRRTQDSDDDGTPDNLDPDDDDDRLPTIDEDADPNGDGIPDDARDTDEDGIPDYLDPDSRPKPNDDENGNGIPDSEEGNGLPDGGVDEDDAGEAASDDDAGAEDSDAAARAARGGVSGSGLCSARPGTPSDVGAVFWFGAALLALSLLRRQRGRARGAFALVMLIAASVSPARADVTLERFTPAALVTDGFAVPHDLTFRHLRVGAMLVLDYAHDPLVWEARLGDDSTIEQRIVHHQLTAHAMASLDLWKYASVFVRLPVNFVMSGERHDTLNADGAGLGNFQLGGRLRVFETREKRFSLGVQAAIGAPTSRAGARHHQLSGEDTLTSQLDLIAASTLGRLRIAGNLGAYLRAPQRVATLSISTLLSFGFGVSYDVWQRGENRIDVIGEFYGASSTNRIFQREETPLEVLFGSKWFTRHDLMFGAGVGAGIISGFGTPTYRLVGMAGWRPAADAQPARPSDADGDGIPDGADQCPKDPEDKDDFQDADGCPDPDNDADGLRDADDRCPLDAEDHDGVADEDGCPDRDDDGDGLEPPVDRCPEVPEDYDGFQDDDGCPEPDNDGDKILDAADNCPLAAEDLDGFEDQDGCPETDNDHDGVLDTEDRCPMDPEVPDGIDDDGCPDVAKIDLGSKRIDIMENIMFETGKSIILPQSLTILNAVAGALRGHPEVLMVRIEGHTDNRGNRQANKILSNDRALSVLTYLVGVGINPERLVAIGFGDARPLSENTTDSGREKNRRVEFHIERTGEPGKE